jgi:hypothetical protein
VIEDRADLRVPVDRAVFEITDTTDAIERTFLIRGRHAHGLEADLRGVRPTRKVIFALDVAVHFVRADTQRPVDIEPVRE